MNDNHNYLIALSGKMHSGKDTVADIIRYLLAVGKQTNSDSDAEIVKFLVDKDNEYPIQKKYILAKSGFEIKRFADKVKQIASLITGIPVEKFEDQEFKKSFLGPEWDTVSTSYAKTNELRYNTTEDIRRAGWNNGGSGDVWVHQQRTQKTVRELLQKIGTDCMRDRLHTDVWTNSLFADWKVKPCPQLTHDGSKVGLDVMTEIPLQKWLITDMRFPNELKAVKERGGLTIRIHRPGHDSGSTHESETALDGFKHSFDVYIINDGSLEDLVKQVRAVLTEFKLL